jgi:hypothetical protein
MQILFPKLQKINIGRQPVIHSHVIVLSECRRSDYYGIYKSEFKLTSFLLESECHFVDFKT